MNKVKITWAQLVKDVNSLATNLDNANVVDHWGITDIIGIARGGLFPAQVVAYKLGIRRVYSFGMTYYKDEEKQNYPLIYQNLPTSLENKVVLVIDELCDTGSTFRLIDCELANRGVKRVYYATIYKKGNGNFSGLSLWVKTFDKDQWIVLPTD